MFGTRKRPKRAGVVFLDLVAQFSSVGERPEQWVNNDCLQWTLVLTIFLIQRKCVPLYLISTVLPLFVSGLQARPHPLVILKADVWCTFLL